MKGHDPGTATITNSHLDFYFSVKFPSVKLGRQPGRTVRKTKLSAKEKKERETILKLNSIKNIS